MSMRMLPTSKLICNGAFYLAEIKSMGTPETGNRQLGVGAERGYLQSTGEFVILNSKTYRGSRTLTSVEEGKDEETQYSLHIN
eukprot:scaffold15651_cov80-Skeletonema_marinoi.AAC.1